MFAGYFKVSVLYSALPAASVDVVIEVCGHPGAIEEGIRCLRPGGLYVLVGLVHPNSKLNLTGETIIRKCLTITGKSTPV